MNKKRSNEYGFTLIELLIAIAIMLSITVLAIVNIVGVSNRKKEEAWQSVKEEIETAATDYFKANEYLFEGLEDENNNTGYISVGKLVNDDYLNKVTDPRTGKAVSYCTLVYIKKSGRSVSVTKIEESTLESCDYESVVTVSNAKNAPKLKVVGRCGEDGKNHWCIGNTKPKAVATATPVNGSEVISIEKDNNTGSNYKCDVNLTSSNNDKKKSCTLQKETKEGITLIAKSVDGGIAKSTIDIGYDRTAPVIKLNIDSRDSRYNTSSVNAKLEIIEDGSGVASVSSTPKEMGTNKAMFSGTSKNQKKDDFKLLNYGTKDKTSSKIITVTVIDEAGNTGKKSVTYTAYSICKETQDGNKLTKRDECPKCSNKPVSLKVTNKQQLLDKYFKNEKCGTKDLADSIYECKNLPACTRKCPVYAENNLPQFQADFDGYSIDENSNIWYINSVKLSYTGDANYWKWYNGNNEIKSCSGKNKCNINSEGKNDISLHGQGGEVCGPDTIYVKKQELQCNTAIKVSVEGNITNGNDSWYKRGNSKDKDHYINMKFTPSKYIKSFDYKISGGFNNSSGSSTSEVNVKTTNDIDGTVSYNVTLYGTDNKKINCSGSFKIDTKKPSCPDVKVDEKDSSFKKGNNYGVDGENGWYRSNIKLIFDKGSDIKSWSWRETTSPKHSYVHINGYDNRPLKLSNQGRTAIWLEITDKAGNYNSCGPKYYNIDTIPPVYHPDKTTYNKKITQWDSDKNKILVGTFKNNTICFINEPGDYDGPSATPYFTDNIGVSGLPKTINNFGSIPRRCSPVYIHFNYYAEDAAGNSTTVKDPNEFIAAYILENGAPHYYRPCSYELVNSNSKKRIFEDQYENDFSKKANFWGDPNPGDIACNEKEPNGSVRYTR